MLVYRGAFRLGVGHVQYLGLHLAGDSALLPTLLPLICLLLRLEGGKRVLCACLQDIGGRSRHLGHCLTAGLAVVHLLLVLSECVRDRSRVFLRGGPVCVLLLQLLGQSLRRLLGRRLLGDICFLALAILSWLLRHLRSFGLAVFGHGFGSFQSCLRRSILGLVGDRHLALVLRGWLVYDFSGLLRLIALFVQSLCNL